MKVRKWVKYSFVILLLCLSFFIGFKIIFKDNNKKKYNSEVFTEKDITSVIQERLEKENLSMDFLIWVRDNFDNSLIKLNEMLEKEEYNLSMWHKVTGKSWIVLNDLYNKTYENMNNVKVVDSNNPSTISIIGDVSLADNWYIMPKYDERGKKVLGILSEEVVSTMTKSDLMIANSEFTVSTRGKALNGKQYTFRANPTRLTIYEEMGIDLVTLANNHVYDFGKDAFLDMLDSFDEYKIPRIGAGRNIEEAMKPYYFIVNGYKIAFVNATRAEKYIMTPEAGVDSPGVFRCYDPTGMEALIKEVKENSDYVIAIIHFGKEGSHDLEKEQVESAKKYIDAGASVVVGHHAHVLQGVEIYNDKPIIYNLGDFIFNANEEETAMFQIKLKDDGSMDYYMLPALQKGCFTDFLKDNAKQKLIDKINSWSINAHIESDGKISKN